MGSHDRPRGGEPARQAALFPPRSDPGPAAAQAPKADSRPAFLLRLETLRLRLEPPLHPALPRRAPAAQAGFLAPGFPPPGGPEPGRSRAPRATPAARPVLDDLRVAELLEETADLLEARHAAPPRVRAYRKAALSVAALREPLAEILARDGIVGLVHLPHVGVSLARAIEQIVRSGRLPLLERLRGQTGPEEILATLPGVGPALALRIHQQLGIETLHELELAAHDGRLERVPGLGPRRIQALRQCLSGRLRTPPHRLRAPGAAANQPAVAELLAVDAEFRREALAGRLPLLTPRRSDPARGGRLPVLRTRRGPRHYTALPSATRRARELGTGTDWVLIYRDDAGGHGQWTVITAGLGPLKGRRIVRGREEECRSHYRL